MGGGKAKADIRDRNAIEQEIHWGVATTSVSRRRAFHTQGRLIMIFVPRLVCISVTSRVCRRQSDYSYLWQPITFVKVT